VPDAGEAAVCRVLPVVGTQILATVSRRTIARTMNDEQVPLFGQGNHRGKIRQKSLVRQLLHTPTIIGTFVPFSTEWVDGFCPRSDLGFSALALLHVVKKTLRV
jgi:hypothetical protein